MKITRQTLSKIMLNAWKLARYGVSRYGGNVKEYFSMALKISWKEAKEQSDLSWSKEYGNRYLLPGLVLTRIRKGQFTLPGIEID